jgi:hypothetical protein
MLAGLVKTERIGLTVLSFGAGQDSTAILYRYLYDEAFRAEFAGRPFIVIGADTGDEHAHTYAHVGRVAALCAEREVEFHWVTPDQGFHSAAWQSLIHQYRRNQTVGLKAGRKSCTDNLKIKVIYRFLADWLARHYWPDLYAYAVANSDDGDAGCTHSEFIRVFARRHGPVEMLLGISAEEAARIAGDEGKPVWMRHSVVFRYPLVEWGWTREDCQRYIAGLGLDVPYPSNCRRCPYSTDLDVLWLARFDRPAFDEWVELEAAKLRKFAHFDLKNFGVFGRRSLLEVLSLAEEKYAGLSLGELNQLKHQRGHCVASKY